MVNFGKIFGEAFRFGFSANRLLPFFIVNVLILSLIFLFIDSVAAILPQLVGSVPVAILSIIITAIPFVLGFGILFLIQLYFMAAITDNAKYYWTKKPKPLSSSYNIAYKKYISVLAAVILSSLIGVAVSLIPFAGWLIAIIISWFFLFIVQFVVLTNTGAVDSLSRGYRLFMDSKLDVFLFWLLTALIGIALFIVALIPLAVVAIPFLLVAFQSLSSGEGLASLLSLIKQNLMPLFAGGVITMAIMSYATVFQEGAKTFFFLEKVKTKNKY